jgi:DNA-binding transcriptional regulator YiaG
MQRYSHNFLQKLYKGNILLEILRQYGVITPSNRISPKFKKMLDANPQLVTDIEIYTNFIKYDCGINVRLRCIIDNITSQPLCPVCNTPTTMRTTGPGTNTFNKFCGNSCVAKSKDTIEKRQDTNIEKYGSTNYLDSTQGKEQTKKTNIEKYGSVYTLKSPTIRNRIKATNLEKYGVENASSNAEVIKKRKATTTEKCSIKENIKSPSIVHIKDGATLFAELTYINVFTSKGKINPKSQNILNKHPTIHSAVIDNTSFLPITSTLRERLFCIFNNINEITVCHCGNITKFNTTTNMFNQYCCQRCAWDDVDGNLEKRKLTTLARYGQEVFNNPEKRKLTNLERFGATTPMGNSDIKLKAMSKWTDEKKKSSVCKRIKANQEKYNADTFASGSLSETTNATLRNRNELHNLHHTDNMSLAHIARILNCSTTTVSRWFKVHDIEVRYDCSYTSEHEIELVDFIKSIVGDTEIITNTRNIIAPYELDIVIPDSNVAIEYCGVYWHSEVHGDRNEMYHNTKHNRCADVGLQLIQLWSSDWVHNREVVESRLRAKLTQNVVRIYARSLNIVELNTHQEREFFDTNHLQGYSKSSMSYALIDSNGKLHAAMSFCKTRFSKQHEYELLRFANTKNEVVIGGASKLFKHFIDNINPESIITYSMRRWNIGSLYSTLGFNRTHVSDPGYYYFKINGDTNKLYHRSNFQKHKLASKLDNFDANFTEWQNMQNNGYDRIWDCGNDVWVWTK